MLSLPSGFTIAGGTSYTSWVDSTRFEPACISPADSNTCGGDESDGLSYFPRGLGLVDELVVDSHCSEMAREGRLIKFVLELAKNGSTGRGVLGVCVDERTALIIRGSKTQNEVAEVSDSGMLKSYKSTYEYVLTVENKKNDKRVKEEKKRTVQRGEDTLLIRFDIVKSYIRL